MSEALHQDAAPAGAEDPRGDRGARGAVATDAATPLDAPPSDAPAPATSAPATAPSDAPATTPIAEGSTAASRPEFGAVAGGDLDGVLRATQAVRAGLGRVVVAHPAISLGSVGFAAATVAMVSGGRLGTVHTTIPLTSWFGLLTRSSSDRTDYPTAITMIAAIGVLALTWLAAIRLVRAGRLGQRAVWTVGAAWALPFVVGPPLLSNDVYSYAAEGLMQRNGISPYLHGPSVLGNVPALNAVDPAWRSTTSPYGTLASLVQHLAVAISGGNPLGAIIVFRGLGLVAAIAIGVLAAELAGPRRELAVTLTALNPLVLLQVVSAAHFEGLMGALVLGALVAANQRKWALGIVLGCCAAEVKAPAFMAVLAIIATHLAGRTGRDRWKIGARDIGLTVVATVGLSFVTPHGLGWLSSLETPAQQHSPLAPASWIGEMFRPVVRSASFDDLATGGRITALLLSGAIVLYLILTPRRRALNRTAGYGLLALGLLSPVVYPWYLLWGVLCLMPTARAARRDWLVLASFVGCVYQAAGFSTNTAVDITLGFAAVGVAVVLRREQVRRRAEAPLGITPAAG